MITKEQIKQGLDKAYKEAGHNAYFGNGFEAGVKFALEQVKNIAYEPVLASVFVIKDTTGDWVRLCKTQESAEEQLKIYEKEHSYAGFYIDEEQLL